MAISKQMLGMTSCYTPNVYNSVKVYPQTREKFFWVKRWGLEENFVSLQKEVIDFNSISCYDKVFV